MGKTLMAKTATLHVISPLRTLAAADPIPGTRLAIRQKVEPVPLQDFRELPAPTGFVASDARKDFDFGNVLSKLSTDAGGIAPGLFGDYLIVLKVAGPLAPALPGTGAIDPENLHDITIEVGYGLA